MPGELSSTRALGPFKKETIGKPAMEAFVAGEPATLAGVASGGVDGFRYDPSWMSMRRVGGGRTAASSGLVSIHRRFAGEWIDFDDQRSLRRRVWPPRAPGCGGSRSARCHRDDICTARICCFLLIQLRFFALGDHQTARF